MTCTAADVLQTGGSTRSVWNTFQDAFTAARHDGQTRQVLAVDDRRAVARDRREQDRVVHDTLLNTLTAIGWTTSKTTGAQRQAVRRRCQRDVKRVERFFRCREQRRTDLPTMLRRSIDEAAAGGLDVRLSFQAWTRPVDLPAPVAAGLVNATSEALRNVHHHAGVRDVAVAVRADGQSVSITVLDAGVGFDQPPAGGLGMSRSIVGRMADLGGSAQIYSARGYGTCVRLTWPLADPPAPRLRASLPAAVVADRRRQLAVLREGALPLVRAIGAGELDTSDDKVRRRCALQAGALRRHLIHRTGNDVFGRIHDLHRRAAARGIQLDVQTDGDPHLLPATTGDQVVATVGQLVDEVTSGRVLVTAIVAGTGCQLVVRGPLKHAPTRPPAPPGATASCCEADETCFYVEVQWP